MRIACAAFALLLAAFPALAQNVKITPIGSHPGELCANDRAIIFEDPTGVRFLYDAAQNVTGGNDPRLGAIHLVLLSHMHGDHVGDLKLKAPGEGTCANSARVPAPNSTTAEVVAAQLKVSFWPELKIPTLAGPLPRSNSGLRGRSRGRTTRSCISDRTVLRWYR